MVEKLEGHQVRDPRRLRANVEVQLDQAAEELTRRLAGRVAYQVVRDAVTDAYHRLAAQAKVHGFLPILAARSAQQRLQSS
ncbi:three-helix bundle dimerization domain-containing protein [Actinosynnema sp. NPDC059335]|uniref:three-helix bundle dimerization domain-containing protein n=1 Tax=Actinosynnema sp. NPDC059335 TaxID=3346804 RepID=UPI00366F3502